MMMNTPLPIADQLRKLGINQRSGGQFIGINKDWMYDLASYSDEAWTTLTLIQFCRLIILLQLDASSLQLDPQSSKLSGLELEPDKWGEVQIAVELRNQLNMLKPTEDDLGWEIEAVKLWLVDNETFAEIPIPAVDAICKTIGIDTCSVIRLYLTTLGRPTQ